MKRLLKLVVTGAVATTLGLSAVAFTATEASAICWTENTNYEPGQIEYDCLGGNCKQGWCCLICTG